MSKRYKAMRRARYYRLRSPFRRMVKALKPILTVFVTLAIIHIVKPMLPASVKKFLP